MVLGLLIISMDSKGFIGCKTLPKGRQPDNSTPNMEENTNLQMARGHVSPVSSTGRDANSKTTNSSTLLPVKEYLVNIDKRSNNFSQLIPKES